MYKMRVMMKKSIMIIACMSTVLLYGAEPPLNEWSIVVGKTTIKLTKGCISSVSNVGLVIVGRNEQQKLREPDSSDNSRCVGRLYNVKNNTVCIKNKDDASASDDDIYKAFDARPGEL